MVHVPCDPNWIWICRLIYQVCDDKPYPIVREGMLQLLFRYYRVAIISSEVTYSGVSGDQIESLGAFRETCAYMPASADRSEAMSGDFELKVNMSIISKKRKRQVT